jgi:hypothetical protein
MSKPTKGIGSRASRLSLLSLLWFTAACQAPLTKEFSIETRNTLGILVPCVMVVGSSSLEARVKALAENAVSNGDNKVSVTFETEAPVRIIVYPVITRDGKPAVLKDQEGPYFPWHRDLHREDAAKQLLVLERNRNFDG